MPKNIPLPFRPGVYRQGTLFQARDRWYDASGVRWHNGEMAPIGGWRAVLDTSNAALVIDGAPRAAYSWRSNAGVSLLAIGVTRWTPDTGGLFMYIDGDATDITPNDLVAGATDGSYVSGGYGMGGYGMGYYGTGSGALTLQPADTWQLDNFGELLVACYTADGRLLYTVDPTDGNDAIPIPNSPTGCAGVVVTPEGFIVALAPGGDGRAVEWADQASLTDWTPSDTNQAGDRELPTKGTLKCGRRTRRQTLLWTDVDVYAMTYIGGEFVYAFEQLGDGCGVISPNAVAVFGDLSIWMSTRGFFRYDGALIPVPCDVERYVFDDLDRAQASKIATVPNALYTEVTWYYPSKADGTGENSRYVTYNWSEQHWTIGKLDRAAGVDQGVYSYPVLLDPSGAIWEHEIGTARPGLTVFAESGPTQIADGDNVMLVGAIIPDHSTLGALNLSLIGAKFPTAAERTAGPYAASEPTKTRLNVRYVRLRVDEATSNSSWVFGLPALEVTLGGRR